MGDGRGRRDGSRTTPVGPFTLPVGCTALSCDLDVRVRVGGRILREDAAQVFALLPWWYAGTLLTLCSFVLVPTLGRRTALALTRVVAFDKFGFCGF